ncbi:bifunctional tRNA (5-methylaminomethyl-2-thiouridine)(34)-methyltransferase MnmD/FAD-dependent 5-carboxymethylaminomethyl-2-thiouridine(34) oxidoreductase MnmC [Uliginosibacterium aquaticum]|uniref:tRNA 5-methylaminomethyl-2-thiouridine biosynthesis bifunctional protein MnmC n=1 Tax=Uliginosibacterium aquaticum TaxID=2731212 RepID=A0ABX2IP29_9RHOO|nr:bifunctional tRNA (5-methylaminomethyl-2-thiouridine)(34)-methyltransferase MnmD/FAD-dependent 5-carboxymethylaminomethyl-2-thiouridine(34) oxidoreductase MnmC [Uliginosibacterium aquaticum]NSL56772.1 bifunctional tRNA (5-methylaminomethyl-2-thiouridine)(34)-methyltransferase MnmD/FAD-dependent 5-carboxymethylaminomethyl-2-thiouridine(34) oxidoreductase MnmC [Uliginosibacterium aquaticum]
MTPLQPASLQFSAEGVPFSSEYGDVYHSASGALAQAEHVFLAGNGLPLRWQGRETFVIVETGFGLGNNFLATWQAWRADAQACKRLHFISVEKHPFTATDLTSGLACSGAPTELAEQLCSRWPLPLPGMHRIEFDGGRVILSLLFGEAEQALQQIAGRANAIFLDGFAPAKNPQMWSDGVFRALASLADSDTTLATWSVSSAVREGLTQAGFVVEKTQGFSGKREMLRGHYRANRPPLAAISERRVLVIGAGLAGSAIAERLAARGFSVDILEAQEDIAQGASGNLAGAFRPLPSKDDNLLSRITRAGFFYGLQHLASLQARGHEVLWEPCGVLHLARSADQERKQQTVCESLAFPSAYLGWVNAAEATLKAGHTASFGGWWFPRGGWIQPRSLVAANIAAGSARIRLHAGLSVARLRREAGAWQALASDGAVLAAAPQVVLANAHDVRRLAEADWLPLRAARGQVSHLPMAQLAPLGVVVCGQGYITPGIGGHAALGASFVVDDFDLALREDEHAENLAKLGRMLPGMAGELGSTELEGRVSLRPVSLDRLPMVGQLPAVTHGDGFNLDSLPRTEGLWMLTGFGARGLVWSSLCGELLAARMCGEPLPIESELAEAMDPARFVIRPPTRLAFGTE